MMLVSPTKASSQGVLLIPTGFNATRWRLLKDFWTAVAVWALTSTWTTLLCGLAKLSQYKWR
eukprot:12921163-Prorocentrum_lima.AAC.1